MSELESYLNTVARLEPDITPIDLTGAAASIAISLKRIADVLEFLKSQIEHDMNINRRDRNEA